MVNLLHRRAIGLKYGYSMFPHHMVNLLLVESTTKRLPGMMVSTPHGESFTDIVWWGNPESK